MGLAQREAYTRRLSDTPAPWSVHDVVQAAEEALEGGAAAAEGSRAVGTAGVYAAAGEEAQAGNVLAMATPAEARALRGDGDSVRALTLASERVAVAAPPNLFATTNKQLLAERAAATTAAVPSMGVSLEQRRAARAEAQRLAELEDLAASQALTIAGLQGKARHLEARLTASQEAANKSNSDALRFEGEARASAAAASEAERRVAAVMRDAGAEKERLAREASELEAELTSERAAAAAAASAHGRARAELEAELDAERRNSRAELAAITERSEADGRRAARADAGAGEARAEAQRTTGALSQTHAALAERETALAASEARRLELEREVRALKEGAASSRAQAKERAAEAEAAAIEVREQASAHAYDIAEASATREELLARLAGTEAKLAELAEAYEEECGPAAKAQAERRVAAALAAQREAVGEVASVRAELVTHRAALDSSQAALAHNARTGSTELALVEAALEAAALGGAGAADDEGIAAALSELPSESSLKGELGRGVSGVAAAARACCEALASSRRTAAARVEEAEVLAVSLRELEEDRNAKARAALDAQRAAIEREAEQRRAREDAVAAMATADDAAAEMESLRAAMAVESAEARAAVEDAARELLAVQLPATAPGATAVAAATRAMVPSDAPWPVLSAFLREQAQRTSSVVATLTEQLATAEARVGRVARDAEGDRAERDAMAEAKTAADTALQAAHNEVTDLREAMAAQVDAFDRAVQQAAAEAAERFEGERAESTEAVAEAIGSAVAAKEAARRLAAAAQVLVRWAGPANAALTSLRSQKAFLTREARRAGERERAAVDALLEVALAARGDAEGGAEGGVGPLPQGVSEVQRLRGARRFRACVLVLLGARRLQASAAARAASGGGARVTTLHGDEAVALLPEGAAEELPTDASLLSLGEADEEAKPRAILDLLHAHTGGAWKTAGESAAAPWALPTAAAAAAAAGSKSREANVVASALSEAVEAVRAGSRRARQERAELDAALAAAIRSADEAAHTARAEASAREELESQHSLLESRLAEFEASTRSSLPAPEAERLVSTVQRERDAADSAERERAAAVKEMDSQLKVMAELRAQASALQVEVHNAQMAQEELKTKLGAARAEAARARDRMAEKKHEAEAAKREADASRRRTRAAEEEAEAARLVLVSAEERTRGAERRAAAAEEARARERDATRSKGRVAATEAADRREATRREHEAMAKAATAQAATDALEARARALQDQLTANAGHAAELGRALDASRARERLDRTERDATARARSELASVRRAAERSLAGLATAKLAVTGGGPVGRGPVGSANVELARIASPRHSAAPTPAQGGATTLRRAAMEAARATAAAAAAGAAAAVAASPARARTEAARRAAAAARARGGVTMAALQSEISELRARDAREMPQSAQRPRRGTPATTRRTLF